MFANRDANTVTGYDDVIELHLDAASAAAKGGHVIIYKEYKPDAMDHRLGNMIANHFGLRGGQMFHGRDNLYNLNTFAKRGISYRLLELGFITNKENMDYFKKHYDRIARDLISAVVNKSISIPSEEKPKEAAAVAKERDVSETHKEAWEWAKKEGLLNGENPAGHLTREQFATVLKRLDDRYNK